MSVDAPKAYVTAGGDVESNWRAVVLFGLNTATYKFALARSLLEIAAAGRETASLEELAVPFSRHLCAHLAEVDTQARSATSRYLSACRHFNQGRISDDELITATAMLGFRNVIDAFHVVNGSDVPTRFFVDERSTSTRGIRLTDPLLALAGTEIGADLDEEAEARWGLVEHAWQERSAGRPPVVTYDHDQEVLLPALLGKRRRVAEIRPALNGYQKGFCFYCYRPILVGPNSPAPADVDHVLPHSLIAAGIGLDLDQVWNLVLACSSCNRGIGGKMAAIPTPEYVEQLHLRNEYLIFSHHPLRDTLILETGATTEARRRFLTDAYMRASTFPVRHGWQPESTDAPIF